MQKSTFTLVAALALSIAGCNDSRDTPKRHDVVPAQPAERTDTTPMTPSQRDMRSFDEANTSPTNPPPVSPSSPPPPRPDMNPMPTPADPGTATSPQTAPGSNDARGEDMKSTETSPR
jgi:hypothetical protein